MLKRGKTRIVIDDILSASLDDMSLFWNRERTGTYALMYRRNSNSNAGWFVDKIRKSGDKYIYQGEEFNCLETAKIEAFSNFKHELYSSLICIKKSQLRVFERMLIKKSQLNQEWENGE